MTAADKYLEAELSDAASSNLMEAADMQSNSDTVLDIIQEIKVSMSHHESLQGYAEQLRVKNLKDLLQNARYRAFLTSDPKLMLAQLDELEVRRELSERASFTCGECRIRNLAFLASQFTRRFIAALPTCPRDEWQVDPPNVL